MFPVPENVGNWAAVKMRYSRLYVRGCYRPAPSASVRESTMSYDDLRVHSLVFLDVLVFPFFRDNYV